MRNSPVSTILLNDECIWFAETLNLRAGYLKHYWSKPRRKITNCLSRLYIYIYIYIYIRLSMVFIPVLWCLTVVWAYAASKPSLIYEEYMYTVLCLGKSIYWMILRNQGRQSCATFWKFHEHLRFLMKCIAARRESGVLKLIIIRITVV